MSRALSPNAATPGEDYRGFRTFWYRGSWYGVPDLVLFDETRPARAFRHPATRCAPSREALEASIDDFDATAYGTEDAGEYDGYRLIRYGDRIFGVPCEFGPIDLNLEEERTRDGVVCGDSHDEVIDRIRAVKSARPVEFLGWLPVFKRFGNCGAHPQFGHTQAPPPGYKFVRSAPAEDDDPPRQSLPVRLFSKLQALGLSLWMFAEAARRHGLWSTLRTLCQFLWFVGTLIRKTKRLGPALRFAHTRHFQSQVMVPDKAELVFVTSVPCTYGQRPWVIEVEDPTTLFAPFILNGRTAELDVRSSPCFPAVKAMLEANHCRGIVTHMRSTAEMIRTLFRSEVIAKKVTYAPLGVPVPKKWQTHDQDAGVVNLLFTNSWHQERNSFFLRGGLDVLEAFDVLRRRYPQLRLTIRSGLPQLPERYYRMIESGWVRVIDRFMPAERMAELQRESHIYLLPAARIHIVSLLQAMSYGQAVVASDGWGMDEYIDHGRNGLIVPGRYGKVSWVDREAGFLRENYGPMYARDKKTVDGLIESVSLLVEQSAVRKRLGTAARTDVETRFTLAGWNAALKVAFDRA